MQIEEEQEVRAGWELKEKKSKRKHEVRAGKTKRKRVEGNKKSEQVVKRERTVEGTKKSEQKGMQREDK